jgi:hypothetical protein
MKKEKIAQGWNSDLGLLLLTLCCFVLFALFLLTWTAASFNWLVLVLIVAACPLFHLFMHRHGRHQ